RDADHRPSGDGPALLLQVPRPRRHGREQREDPRPGHDRGRWDDAADGMALSRLRGPVRVHAQRMGRPRVRGRPETAYPGGRVALHPGRPAAQRDGGVAVAATARYTREQIWAPPATERRDRLRHSTRHLLVGTSAVALLFAIVGSWTGRPGSLFKATMLGALVFFTPWAALQQMLFQFYLLGRLRVLIPASPALTLAAMNGVLFGAVHLPDVELTVLTII